MSYKVEISKDGQVISGCISADYQNIIDTVVLLGDVLEKTKKNQTQGETVGDKDIQHVLAMKKPEVG